MRETTPRVLVVDDTPINLELVATAVRSFGYHVIEAHNGIEALELLGQQNVDLVLLDYLMPDMSGLEVLKEIRKHYSALDLPVIIVTGFYDANIIVEALQNEATDYINKPFEYEVLKARMQVHLHKKAVEQQLLQAKIRAEEVNRAKSNFVSFVSHEIRTPISSIIGFSSLLQHALQGANAPAQHIEHLSRIKAAGERLLKITHDILDLTQVESGRLQLNYSDVRLNELINAICTDSEPLMAVNNNQFRADIKGNLGIMHTDATRLRQIIDNLLSNAAKYTNNGAISLSVSSHDTADGKQLQIDVWDTGIGIARDKIKQLFKEFSQTHDPLTITANSIGLGLMITRQLCEHMGGTIAVESNQDSGTTFSVHIPYQPILKEHKTQQTIDGTV